MCVGYNRVRVRITIRIRIRIRGRVKGLGLGLGMYVGYNGVIPSSNWQPNTTQINKIKIQVFDIYGLLSKLTFRTVQ